MKTFIINLFFGGSFMNKKNIALILGLMLNIVPVCCADEVQATEQEATALVCTEDVCPVTEVTAPVAQTTSSYAEATEDKPVVESVIPTEEVTAQTVAPEVQPEEELTEEQLKKLLDQILADMKQEEDAKNAQAPIAA